MPAEIPEAELVARVQAGDGYAYNLLVQQHREAVFRLAYLISNNSDDAEDITPAVAAALSELEAFAQDDSRHAGTRVILGPPMMASAFRHNVSFTVAGSIQGNIQDSIVKHEPWLAPAGSTLQRLSSARNSGPDPVAAAICAICFVLIAMCMCILWLLLFERYYLRQPPGRLLFDSSRQNLTL